MKKLIVLSVVFVLLASAAFAVDLSGTVFGNVTVLEGNSGKDSFGDANPITAGGGFKRLRLEGSGDAMDGVFSGWIRLGDGTSPGFSGMATWKPLDMFKLSIGGNPDGVFGKEGVTGWSFYQNAYDTDNIVVGGNVWGWGPINGSGSNNMYGQELITRNAFFGGFGGNGALLTITPAEIATINIVIPFIDQNGKEAADVFMKSIAQVDLNFAFGNIALTYVGGTGSYSTGTIAAEYDANAGKKDATKKWVAYDKKTGTLATATTSPADVYWVEEQASAAVPASPEWVRKEKSADKDADPSKLFLYFNLSSIENLGIDVGFAYTLPVETAKDVTLNSPIAAGLGVKYATDTFGVKLRAIGSFAGSVETKAATADIPLRLLVDVLPYYVINDNLRAFFSAGIGYTAENKVNGVGPDSVLGWHINPYLQVGSEWGPSFWAGVKVYSGGKMSKDTDAVINWAVPIAIQVSF